MSKSLGHGFGLHDVYYEGLSPHKPSGNDFYTEMFLSLYGDNVK